MRFDVIVLPEALNDLDEIIAGTKQRSPDGAARLLAAFHCELTTLASRPRIHPRAPEGQVVKREIRQMFFRTRRGRTYRALFEIRGDRVLILHVRGPRQNLLSPEELRDEDVPPDPVDD